MARYVIPFEELRMTDVEHVGGKNASLGEMISQLAAGRARAGRLCHHRRRPIATFWRRGSGRSDRGRAGKVWTSTMWTRWPNRCARSASGSSTRRCRRNPGSELRAAYAKISSPNPARKFASPCVPRPPRKTCRMPPLPVSRKPSSISCGLDNILHAIKEVFASLYNDRAIAYRVHKGFIHAEVALSAGVQRMVRSRHWARRRDVHPRYRIRLSRTWCSSPHPTVWAKPWCRARSTRTSSTCTSRLLAEGKPAVVRRNLGSQADQDGFSAETGRPARAWSPRTSMPRPSATVSRSTTTT